MKRSKNVQHTSDQLTNLVKMWSSFLLCLIVGFAFASNAPAWKDNKEYVYKIRGRALAGLEIANEFSGILLKASLRIQPRPDGTLQAMIVNPQYTQIHSELSDGWMAHIPDHELSWKPLEMSRTPFQMKLNRGIITDLIVNEDVPNWEANMIKGIMSQFQMSLSKADWETSRNDNRPDSAFFSVDEETVSGFTDTLYEVSPMPKHYLLNHGIQNFITLEEDVDEILEVRKSKNYTSSIELPSFVYGFGNVKSKAAAANVMGKFFLRTTTTRALITGNLKQYTIQNSLIINEIAVNPTLGDKQRGSVYTLWNSTLQEVKYQEQIIDDIPHPISLGGLVYAYAPFSQNNQVQERKAMPFNPAWLRLHPYSSSDFKSNIIRKNKQPQMDKAPEAPFLPFNIGNKGRSIKSNVDIVQSTIKMARVIGEILQDPSKTIEENTLGMFVTLTNFVRIMDQSELRQVSKELSSTIKDRSKYAAWAAFRDAVAEAGHGPALLMIESWIELKKIKEEEAAHVISTMVDAVQYPTTQYIKTFFYAFIKNSGVSSQWPLNETTILGYSWLVRKVYFEKNYNGLSFPINSFENLTDKDGLRFVRDTVIPYFFKQLEKAMVEAQTNKIHTFIRALGYIGEPEILKAYEPYLEGKKNCTQYQRTLMIISMDRLVKTYPKIAQEILFRIYLNSGETSAVRVAAVFQLMRTSPPVEMLQHMASYTNIDTDEQVNAAVKSSILSAAKLESNEFQTLRNKAEMAQTLLTDKEYGIHQGGNFLKTYVIDQLDTYYKETVQVWGSDFGWFPNGIKYALRSDMRGFRNQILNIQSLVSSFGLIGDLLEKQTEKYTSEKEEQLKNAGEQAQYPWSGQNIAKILNMKSKVLEQLEGSIFLMDMNSPYKMFSFDNKTLERLPEFVKRWEDKLQDEQEINYVKFVNNRHMDLAVPNAMGLPFVFTYNAPMFFKAHGKIKASATPRLMRDNKLWMPDILQAEMNVALTVGAKVQGRITFLTPFDGQQYISGFNKVLQVHIPLISTMKLDMKDNKVLNVELRPNEVQKKTHLLHYSTWPYISRKNIMNFDKKQQSQVIKPQTLRRWDRMFGKKDLGLTVQVELEHPRLTKDVSDIRVFCKQGIVSGLRNLWDDANIQYTHLNISYLPDESLTKTVAINLRYKTDYQKQGKEKSLEWEEILNVDNSSLRQQILMDTVASGVHNVKQTSVDVMVQFEGKNNIKYLLSGAYAFSSVDPMSRVYALFKKENQGDTFKFIFQTVNKVPNTNFMDIQDILSADPKATSEMEVRFDSKNGEAKITADINLKRSEERKEYLKQQPMFQQCTRDSRVGNKQSSACVNMTVEANLLDKVNMDVEYENIDPQLQDVLQSIYYHWRYHFFPNLDFKNEESSLLKNQMKLQAWFDHDLKYINVSVSTHEQETTFKDIKLGEYMKRLLVVHPMYGVFTRMATKVLEIESFQSTCVVDRTQITTFTNWTYPADFSRHWALVTQYVPKVKENVEEQLRQQRRNYAILMRKSAEYKEKKDIEIVISSPETKFQLYYINMYPTQDDSIKVTVNSKEIKLSATESYTIEKRFLQMFALPNGEVKLELRDKFSIIYDGERANIATWNGFMRNSARGLCGQYNGQQNEELLTPHNCFTPDLNKFIRSHELEGDDGEQARQALKNDPNVCFKKDMPLFVNVIMEKHVNVFGESEDPQGNDCTHYQTKYVEQNQEICFSTHVLPACKSHCQAQGFVTKTIAVHCIPQSPLSLMWKKQIESGSNPDLSHKSENRKLQIEVPQSCLA